MKRLFVSAALLPLVWAAGASAETKITTAVTTPVKTSTAANGQPDDLTVDTAGSVRPTAPGAAVTLDSNNAVKNLGAIGFNNVDNATGILITGGHTGAVTNSSAITVLEDFTPTDSDNDGDLDGPFAQGSGRYGIRLTGGAFTGDIKSDAASSITIEGNDSAGVSLEGQLNGNLVQQGAVSVAGDRSVGVRAGTVTGAVRVLGSVSVIGEGSSAVVVDNIGGQLQLQSSIIATGYRSTTRLADAARAKLDADDLKQGGAAVRVTGDVGGGVLIDRPPLDADTNNTDEDGDGIADASEGTASILSYGAAPGLDLGSMTRATTIGAVGTGDTGYGLVIRGDVAGSGVNDGISATGIRIGQAGGGATTVTGGINNQAAGRIGASAFGAQATALLINAGSVVPRLTNGGTIAAGQTGGLHDARAIVDLSGSLTLIENTGSIGATITPASGVTQTGKAIAIDLSANTAGATVRQTKLVSTDTPAITGDVLLGSGADLVDIRGGTLTGALSFGGGADALNIDGAAVVTGRITDADGQLGVTIGEGKLALSNLDTVNLSSLNLGAKSVLAVTVDPASAATTRLNVSGSATIASGAEIDLKLASQLKTQSTFEVVHAGSLQVGAASANLVGAPFLYAAQLQSSANSLSIAIRPKTAAELGLNRSGAQAYAAVFDALDRNDTIEQAFLAQTSQAGFQGLYDQMLPDHSGGALASAQAISGAISAAIGTPGVKAPDGATAVWAQEIFFHIDRDREQALGFESQGMGLAAGIEVGGTANTIGLNTALITDEYHDKGAVSGERVVMNFLEGGGYWRLTAGGFRADARAGLAYVKFDSDRRFALGAASVSNSASWNGWLGEAHAAAAYEAHLGWFVARPELTVDYVRLSEDGYQESGGGTGFDLKVDDRQGDLLTGQALLTLGAHLGEESWFNPELTVGWRAKLAGDPGQTTARFAGGNPFTLDPEDVASGGMVARVALRGGMENAIYSFQAGGVFDDGYREYDVRAVVRFVF